MEAMEAEGLLLGAQLVGQKHRVRKALGPLGWRPGSIMGLHYGLNCISPQNSYVEVSAPRTSEGECIWS